MDSTQLESNIWPLIKKYDLNSLNFSNIISKLIIQLIRFLINLIIMKNFCIKYKNLKRCTNCGLQSIKEEYVSPLIMFDLNDLNNYNIINKINSLLNKEIQTCNIYNWTKEGKIINPELFSRYRTIIEWELPKIFGISFDFAKMEDIEKHKHKNNIFLQNQLIFNRMKSNLEAIKKFY